VCDIVNNLVTIFMSQINTFTSHDAVNEDAESPELERGAWLVVAWYQHGGSGDPTGARAWHLTAASVSVLGTRPGNRSCGTGWRRVSGCDVQDSSQCTGTVASLFRPQWFDAERGCHPRPREVFHRDASARQTWLSDRQNLLPYIWNSLSIACSQSSCSTSMDYSLPIASVR